MTIVAFMSYSSVARPAYLNAAQTAILCVVKFDHLPDPMLFCAASYDVEPHGRQIFNECVAGKYGSIVPFGGQK